MKNAINKSEAANLRQKATDLLKRKRLSPGSQSSEAETLKLIHELEVHQIELELQNEELMLARAAAQDASAKYFELYDFAPTGYFTLSREGKILELNLSGAQKLGKERSKLINSQFGFFVSNDTKQIFHLFLEKVFNSDRKETCEVTLEVKDNLPTYVYLTGIMAENKEQCLVTSINITELKQAEELLVASEANYRRLFETAKDGILILDAKTGKITDVNPFLTEMLGYSAEQLIQKEIWEIGFFKDIAANYEKFLELQQNNYVRYDDLPLETADGLKINVEFVSNVYEVDHHKAIQCNIRDITKRKRAEKELIEAKEKAEESDRLKSAFLANMSHEIRTPMNGILGFTDLLKEPNLTGEKQQKYISIIEESGTRMLNILNDIVSISKVEAGQMEVSLSKTNVNRQIEYLYTFFKPAVEEKEMELSYKISLPDEEAIINTDREKVYAILTNLVKNALKFTNSGTIELGYAKKGKYLEFFVKDTGIGIRKEQQEMVFERFRQGSESLNRNFEGAGLGLSISKAYVEILGGKIWLESEEGKGSTFYFTIPYDAVHEEKIVPNVLLDDIDVEEKEINNLKILIAEDNKLSEMLIIIAVEMYSKEIIKAKNGIEAVIACRNNPDIDLILMDIHMPEMDGYEATRQIRHFNKDVIIIAQTANALSGEREKVIEAGCNDYISKPFNQRVLQDLIHKYFDRKVKA